MLVCAKQDALRIPQTREKEGQCITSILLKVAPREVNAMWA